MLKRPRGFKSRAHRFQNRVQRLTCRIRDQVNMKIGAGFWQDRWFGCGHDVERCIPVGFLGSRFGRLTSITHTYHRQSRLSDGNIFSIHKHTVSTYPSLPHRHSTVSTRVWLWYFLQYDRLSPFSTDPNSMLAKCGLRLEIVLSPVTQHYQQAYESDEINIIWN